jgi:hypothetical protein
MYLSRVGLHIALAMDRRGAHDGGRLFSAAAPRRPKFRRFARLVAKPHVSIRSRKRRQQQLGSCCCETVARMIRFVHAVDARFLSSSSGSRRVYFRCPVLRHASRVNELSFDSQRERERE